MRVHLVGIGGAGMSALANVYLARGVEVSGSDLSTSALLDELARAGARIHSGHDEAHLGAPDLVVRSTAIADDNPELSAARARRIPIVHRGLAAADLSRGRRQVVIAGTHGKTTTTTFVAELLRGLDPLVLSGGRLPDSVFNSRPGMGGIAVIEGDESDGSFLELSPEIAAVTNIEADHLDRYRDLGEIREAFTRFATKVSGALVGCVDDPGAAALLDVAPGEVLTYGFKPADFMGADYRGEGGGSRFEIQTPSGDREVRLRMPGRHNALNAIAACAVSRRLGLDLDEVVTGLARVRLPGRRLELVAEVNGARVYDDYGHHPTEVATTLRAARELTSGRLICAFQPHRPSRLRAMLRQFGGAFEEADEVYLVPVYSAGEPAIEGIDSERLAAAIWEVDPGRPVAVLSDLEQLPEALRSRLQPGDVAICMGAGDIDRVSRAMNTAAP